MRRPILHIAAVYVAMATAPLAQAADECAAFLADIQFCYADIGLDVAAQESPEEGGFLNSEAPSGSVVYVYATPTALPVPQNPQEHLDAMNSGYLLETGASEKREILSSGRDLDAPLTVLRSVRYSFAADQERVFAITTILLDGINVTVMTVESGVGANYTDDHQARHVSALNAMQFPKTDIGCHALPAGQQLCTADTIWRDLTPYFTSFGLALTNVDDAERNLLITQTGPADPERSFDAEFVGQINQRLVAADMSSVEYADTVSSTANGRDWQVVDYTAETQNGTQISGRSSTSIADSLFQSIRTSRTATAAEDSPTALAEIHEQARASLSSRPTGDAGWIRLELKD